MDRPGIFAADSFKSDRLLETGAGEGNRTLVVSLGSFCSTIELHPRNRHFTRVCGGMANLKGGGCDGKWGGHFFLADEMQLIQNTKISVNDAIHTMKYARFCFNAFARLNK